MFFAKNSDGIIFLCLNSVGCLFSAALLPANVLFHRTCLRLAIQLPNTHPYSTGVHLALLGVDYFHFLIFVTFLIKRRLLGSCFLQNWFSCFWCGSRRCLNSRNRLFDNHVWHFVRSAPGRKTGPKSSKSWEDLAIGPLNITFKILVGDVRLGPTSLCAALLSVFKA